ncbi:MAG: flippase activity-associated protein Agl23 [Halanaeroarchaeum sp.]
MTARSPDWLTARRTLLALLVVSLLGTAARLVALGARVFYYDEAWFGYWTLRFMETGVWEYRPILHGPFFVRVNPIVFETLGATDAAGRLVVAVIGGLLPLAAWLYRDHLDRGEVLATGVALALNPILLYYSRFMRKDLPLAAFAIVALGLFLRAHATGRDRYLYAGAISLGLAFTTKESVLLWMVTWLGAGALVLDRHLLRARDTRDGSLATLGEFLDRSVRGLRDRGRSLGIAGLLWFVVVVFFYAPRAGPGQPVGIWRALAGEFGTLPDVVATATLGSLRAALDYWAHGTIQQHAYLPYLVDTLSTMWAGALGVSLLATVGFLVDRYGGAAPRGVVAFNFFSGVAAVLGYPLANNLPVPWSTVHAVVPLTIPAGVGALALLRWGRAGVSGSVFAAPLDDPRATIRTTAVVVLIGGLVVSAGATALETSYRAPHESPRGDGGSEIVYYAQAPASLDRVVGAVNEASASGGTDTDVLYVGPSLAMDESAVAYPPATGAWHARMPLPWYTEAAGADVASVPEPASVGPTPPPVVVTTPALRAETASRLGATYESRTYARDDVGDRIVVVFTRGDG